MPGARLLTPAPIVLEQVWQVARLEGDLDGGLGGGRVRLDVPCSKEQQGFEGPKLGDLE